MRSDFSLNNIYFINDLLVARAEECIASNGSFTHFIIVAL